MARPYRVKSQDERDSRTQSDAKWRRSRTMGKTKLVMKLREKPDEEESDIATKLRLTQLSCFMRKRREGMDSGENNGTLVFGDAQCHTSLASSFATVLNRLCHLNLS
jgi:hypothetical protein